MLGIAELGVVVGSRLGKVVDSIVGGTVGAILGTFDVGLVVGNSERIMLGNVLGEREGIELLLTCKDLRI